jgi:hypothetical protein
MAERFDHVLDEVDCYLHEVLTPEQNAYLERHCERCPVCKAALAEAEKRFAALKSLPAREAPAGLVQAALAAVDRHDARAARWRLLRRRVLIPAAAAALLVIAGLHIVYWAMAPVPYDLRIVGQSRLHAGAAGALRVMVVHDEKRAPLADVPVRIDLRDPEAGTWLQLAQFTTDALGTGQPHFQLPDWKAGTYDLRVTATPAGTTQSLVRPVELTRSWKLMLTSDRPVYRPGDTIHVRALALRGVDLRPAAGQDALVTIADPRGNIVYKQKQATSAFGICAGDCPLATELLEGTYTVECRLGDSTTKLGVEVKKYVLPKFKVELAADKPMYLPGQRIGGSVRAAYFFGKPAASADVVLTLRRAADKNELAEAVKLRTDAKGDVSFEFPLPPVGAGKDQDDLALELTAAVTDTAGQKQARTVPILVTPRPLRIEVMPEGGTLVAGMPNRIYFYVHGADGRPVQARIVIDQIGRQLTTSDLGVAVLEYTPISSKWTVRAIDAQGREGRREFSLEVGQAGDDFIFRTDRAVYAGGDTVHLTALGGGDEPVFVDFLKDGQTLYTAAIPLAGGRGEHQFDLPPDLFGTVQVFAYRLEGTGMKNTQRRVLYVHAPRQIDIATTMDKPEYRPGGTAKLRWRLADRNGRPTPGALSLAAVDEASFAVLGQSAGAEKDFYSFEQELLRPVLQLYPWSPAEVRGDTEESRRFEQALFATTSAAPPGDREALIKALLPFAENDRRVFDVLDDPKWESTFENNEKAKRVRGLFANRGGPQSLVATTMPENQQRFAATKAALGSLLNTIWIILAILTVLVALFLVWRALSAALSPVGAAVLLLFFPGLCLLTPSVQKVREASARTQALNDLKQVELAVENFKSTYKKFPPSTISLNSQRDSTSPRIRDWFPETLLWRPEIITDDKGEASLDLALADSITTWRLTASAVAADGRLGASREKIKVFQPFFVELDLPVALTLGDEVAVPVVVYNYLDRPQSVALKFADAPWFARLGEGSQRLELAPGEVRSTHFRLRARKVGTHEFTVTATGAGVADAVRRQIEVLPGGRRVEAVWNGTLHQSAEFAVALPEEAIPGSGRLFVKVYPSRFSQVVEGLDAIFRLPSGCFEQTSSTTYPNVLALDYLRRNHKSLPAVEAKARHYIHLGYQRLASFEVSGGGFDWFGRPPANRVLTAYGLMEFQDMARVHDVDAKLIERTRNWLVGQRQADGSWAPEGHVPSGTPGGGLRGDKLARLSTTAYIAWAVYKDHAADAGPTRSFLLAHEAPSIGDPHALALVANALLTIDQEGRAARPYLERLEALKRSSADGKQTWWEQGGDARTTFYGGGRGGKVETTALASLALLRSGSYPASARAALAWLVRERDGAGTWHSTQATVLALKAMLAAGKAGTEDRERRLEWTWDNDSKQTEIIPPDQAEVLKQLDLTKHLSAGTHTLKFAEPTGGAASFQVIFRYHVPATARPVGETLALDVKYEREKVRVGENLQAVATLTNKTGAPAPMVMLELPVPAGFVAGDAFAQLAAAGRIAKFEIKPLAVLVYLRELPAGKTLSLAYDLRAAMPAQVVVPAARVYEYYDPDRQGTSAPARLAVVE